MWQAKLPKYPGVGRLERFLVAGPGKAHGRPRATVFVLACTNWTFVGTEAALEQHERDGSVAPHMPEMEAEVAAVTRHRSLTRLEAAKPRTAPSHRALLRAFRSAQGLACMLSDSLSTSD